MTACDISTFISLFLKQLIVIMESLLTNKEISRLGRPAAAAAAGGVGPSGRGVGVGCLRRQLLFLNRTTQFKAE